MSPYEILQPGGSVEHHNAESGATWLQRLLENWPSAAWLNPEPQGYWQYRQSIAIITNIMHEHMYCATVNALAQAMRHMSTLTCPDKPYTILLRHPHVLTFLKICTLPT